MEGEKAEICTVLKQSSNSAVQRLSKNTNIAAYTYEEYFCNLQVKLKAP